MTARGPRARSEASARAGDVDEPLLAAIAAADHLLCATFVFAFPLATPRVATALSVSAFAGAMARARPGALARAPAAAARGAALSVALFGALRSLSAESRASRVARSTTAMSVIDALALGGCTCAVAAFVRALALRRRSYRMLEVAFVGAAFAQLVAGHRGGAINRPFELADSIIARGGDPTIALLAGRRGGGARQRRAVDHRTQRAARG